jgi:hypothetical protein
LYPQGTQNTSKRSTKPVCICLSSVGLSVRVKSGKKKDKSPDMKDKSPDMKDKSPDKKEKTSEKKAKSETKKK